MDTEGCFTLKYKDGVCDLGGFHASHDGPEESEMILFNNLGSVSNNFIYSFLSSSSPGPFQVHLLKFILFNDALFSLLPRIQELRLLQLKML